MKIMDAGVSGESFMDFTIPTEFAKRALYYIPQYGHFLCDGDYNISRQTLDWFLMIYVCAGTLHLESRGGSAAAHADQIVLLDCRFPHRYYCIGTTDFLWFHFCGNSSEAYAEALYEQAGMVFPAGRTESRIFQRIFSSAQLVPCDEHLISSSIHHLLGCLASPKRSEAYYQPLAPAIDHIRNHFDQPLPLDELSARCSMSTSHFIRSFQKHLGRTPHEYLLAYRLRQSKQLLLTTDLTMEQIAEKCGFNSASHFARAFRASNNLRPSEFRRMQF